MNGADSGFLLLKQLGEIVELLGLIGHLHNQQLQFYRQNKFKVKLPHLLSEIFEIENGPSGVYQPKAELPKPLADEKFFNGNLAQQQMPETNGLVLNQTGMFQSIKSEQQQQHQTSENGQYQIIHLSQNDFNRLSSSGSFHFKPQACHSSQQQQQQHLILNNQRQQQLMIIQSNQS